MARIWKKPLAHCKTAYLKAQMVTLTNGLNVHFNWECPKAQSAALKAKKRIEAENGTQKHTAKSCSIDGCEMSRSSTNKTHRLNSSQTPTNNSLIICSIRNYAQYLLFSYLRANPPTGTSTKMDNAQELHDCPIGGESIQPKNEA